MSGGIDGTVLLQQIRKNAEVLPLFVDYGQRAVAPERGRFWFAFRDLAAELGEIKVETPLIHRDKTGIVEEGQGLGVDLTLTYSCIVGRDRHCGTCRQCRDRRKASARTGRCRAPGFLPHHSSR